MGKKIEDKGLNYGGLNPKEYYIDIPYSIR